MEKRFKLNTLLTTEDFSAKVNLRLKYLGLIARVMLYIRNDQERKMKSKAVSGIAMVLLSTITISFVNGTEFETVTVEPGDIEVLNFFLEKGQKIKGSLTIVAGNEIDFFIRTPSGGYVVELDKINQEAEFEFVSEESGVYAGVFRNLFSSQSAIIELSYDIYSPLMIDIFTLFLIVVGLATIIIIIIWWRS